jgi:hypothetical protein
MRAVAVGEQGSEMGGEVPNGPDDLGLTDAEHGG